MSRRISSLRPKKLSSAAPRTASRPNVFSLATDHQLVRMKPICLLARCSWSPACCQTRHCSGVSVWRNRKRVKTPWRALCTRVMSWRARTSISEAFLMAPSICAAMPLRRWRSATTSGSSGGSLAAGGAPSLAICERTSSSGLRSLSAASLALFSIFSMPVRRAARSRWEPGDCSRFFSAASMALCRLLTGLTISSIDGPLALGAGGGAGAGARAEQRGGSGVGAAASAGGWRRRCRRGRGGWCCLVRRCLGRRGLRRRRGLRHCAVADQRAAAYTLNAHSTRSASSAVSGPSGISPQ